MNWLIAAGVAYCVLDVVLAFRLGRCVVPGLKCRACRDHEARMAREWTPGTCMTCGLSDVPVDAADICANCYAEGGMQR